MAVVWKKLTFSPHASDHLSGGSDAIKLDDLAAPDDNVDLNASTLKHGLLPKLGGGAVNFLRADGTWAEPPGGGGVTDHGDLTGLGDNDHTQYHNNTRGDARYFQKTEFLNVSAGAGDAGKPIKLDAAGHVDASMINDADIALANLGEKAHGSLTGVVTDQHHARYTDAEAVASVESAGLFLGYDAHIYATDSLIRAARTHMIGPPLSSDQLGDGDIFQGRHIGVDKFKIDKDGNLYMVGKVDGVDISGFKYLSMGPPAFVPYSDENDWVIAHDGLFARVLETSQTFSAPISLPHGAVISRLTLFGERTAQQADLILQLYRDDNVGGSVLMAEVVAGWTSGASSGYDDTIDYATISNTSYSYNLVLTLDPFQSVSSVGFYRAQINLA